MRLISFLHWVMGVYWLLVLYFGLNDSIAFGHGLGDIIYIFFVFAIALLHAGTLLLIYFQQRKERWKNAKLIAAVVFGLLAIWIAYSFTFGRGAEFSWNGHVFR
jgi:uncharacterized protein YhhL (DUF1145 family)